MTKIVDDRGFNQIYKPEGATKIRLQRRATFFAEEMDKYESCSVLEIGCGTGEVSYWIAQQIKGTVIGTDLSQQFVDQANQNYKLPNLQYKVVDFNKPEDLNNQKFDYIIGNGILHHLYYNLDEVFISFKKLLSDKGKIIFMEPNIYNPYCTLIFKIPTLRKSAKLEPDEMAFSKPFVTTKLKKHSYTNIKVAYRDFLLPGIPMWLVNPSIYVGNVLEKIPLIKMVSQSIFIVASK
jgi:2-polyprenyl-3-methyl-5-hydroxy-6-metoxy-1,4-benzoquinol methylase